MSIVWDNVLLLVPGFAWKGSWAEWIAWHPGWCLSGPGANLLAPEQSQRGRRAQKSSTTNPCFSLHPTLNLSPLSPPNCSSTPTTQVINLEAGL